MTLDAPTAQQREGSEDYLLAMALSVNRRVNTAGLSVRLLCLLGLAGIAIAQSGWDQLRFLQLFPGVVGLGLAALEIESVRLTRWADAGSRWSHLARHLVACRDVAAVSASATLEALGLLGAALLVAGPAPIALSAPVRELAVALLTIYIFDVALQIALDVGYYNEQHPAASWMLWARRVLPVALSGCVWGLLAWPSPGRVSASTVVVCAASILLLWPVLATVQTVYSCGRQAANAWILKRDEQARFDRAIALHHVKSLIFGQMTAAAAAAPDGRAPGEMVYQRLRAAVEAERRITASNRDLSSMSEIWADVISMDSLKRAQEAGCLRLDDVTGGVLFRKEDSGLIRHLIIDLADNSLRHGATRACARVILNAAGARRVIVGVSVDDDGPGYDMGTLPPTSSLVCLRRLLGTRHGELTVAARSDGNGGGTCAAAHFKTSVSRPPDESATASFPGSTNPTGPSYPLSGVQT